MAPPALKRMTPEEFYRWPGEEGVRYELVDGFPVTAMTGASGQHDDIVVNALTALKTKLRGSPCRPSTDDIAIPMMNGNIRRPDVSVDCGDRSRTSFEASLPRVLLWWRAPGDIWELAQFDGLDGVIDLSAIGAELSMAELYEDVTFPDPLAGGGALG